MVCILKYFFTFHIVTLFVLVFLHAKPFIHIWTLSSFMASCYVEKNNNLQLCSFSVVSFLLVLLYFLFFTGRAGIKKKYILRKILSISPTFAFKRNSSSPITGSKNMLAGFFLSGCYCFMRCILRKYTSELFFITANAFKND